MRRNKDIPQIWELRGGDGGGYRVYRDMTHSELEEREAGQDAYEKMQARQQAFEERRFAAVNEKTELPIAGYVFAKSCNLPDGKINYTNPNGFIPLERLSDYGMWAVLGTGAAITAQSTPLEMVGGSATGRAIAKRLGGSLALTLLEGSTVVAAGAAMGTIALLMPNTSTSPDSAFYKSDQYAMLDVGLTRARVNMKTLPDGSVNVYGFYTGGKRGWGNVPVIAAKAEGQKFVADIGNGVGLIWTPAENPDDVMGIPALEGVPLSSPVWVYPPTEQADQVLVNPVHPPDYQDAIIWFPGTGIEAIYISLSVLGNHGYHPAPKQLTAFPDAAKDKSKNNVQGGGKKRARWKDSRGRIYEWDSQHGAVEMYDKQGRHLGEYNPETGEQTKPAKPGRTTPK